MFRLGKTVEDIAAERTLAVSTIESHLAKAIASSRLELNDYMSQEESSAIEAGITEHGTNGLRGLDYYTSATTSAYGTSGTAITNGIHSIDTQSKTGALAYDDIVNLTQVFPPQYWALPGNAWMMHPDTIHNLRNLGPTGAIKQFAEVGEEDGGAVANIFGFPVIPNANIDVVGAGNFPVYLANWPLFMTIADVEEMTIQAMEQTSPGYITLYCEKRLVSTVRDPFAGVRLAST
jgi:HK97 family phage major capsid protein